MRFDVACLGETMAMLTPVNGQPLVTTPPLSLTVGGAESNVACGLAARGFRTTWISRLGADPFGDLIRAELAARGVDLHAVEADPNRPTGIYFKDPGPVGTTVHYYRRGSAASAMDPGLADHDAVRGARLLHVSGITPALSPSCAALMRCLVLERRADGPTVSFDVNHRPGLWSAPEAAAALLPLARAADVVFVGRDEAERLWGTPTADTIRELLADVPELVVKDAELGATAFVGESRYFSPAPRVAVVEPVGAGDAFAAGYLAGLLEGRDPSARLRLGHLGASTVLAVAGDLADPPPRAECDRLVSLSAEEWSALDVRALSTVEDVS